MCRCSKGFRSVRGHGHLHCRHCEEPFRNRSLLFRHEAQAHGKTEPDSADTTAQDKSPDSVKKKPSQRLSSSRNENENCDKSSPNGQDAGVHCQNQQACDVKLSTAKTLPSGESVSVDTFPPYSRKKMRPSNNDDGQTDGQKYATRVTISADGRELITRVPCYSGNLDYPTAIPHGHKTRCPICGALFVRFEALQNHIICVHNVIRAGETVYCCTPCKYETSHSQSFSVHRASYMHRSNLDRCRDVRYCVKRKPEPSVNLAFLRSQQRGGCFYSGVRSQSNASKFGDVQKQSPRVVWYGHSNHLCSSECLSGLSALPTSADDVSSPTLRPRKSVDTPTDKDAPTLVTAVDASDPPRKLRSSAGAVKKNVTACKSTAQRLKVAFSFMDKMKKAAPRDKAHSTPVTAKKSAPRSVDSEASLLEDTITITDSDSDSEVVKNSPIVTRSSNTNKKQTASAATKPTGKRKDSSSAAKSTNSGASAKVQTSLSASAKQSPSATAKPSVSSTDKRKDSSTAKSTTSSGTVKVQTPASTSAAGSHATKAFPVRCLDSSGSPSVVSISQRNLCKSTTSAAVKAPICATTTAHVPQSHSTSMAVNSLSASVASIVSAVTSSRSVPVIGVAKAVPAVTTVTQTTVTSGRSMYSSMYSLHRFSPETLWSELCRRGGMRSCECGISFMDSTLYMLHRSCHSDLAPLKCAFCDHTAATTYDFHAHLLDHKK